jgi:hypothetical protein
MGPVRLLLGVSLLVCLVDHGSLGAAPPVAGANPASLRPPVPPAGTATPIDFFRQLLAANAELRTKLLAGKTPHQRQVLENSLRSYDALPPEQREARLRIMELRYRLTTLLRLPPSNRVERLQLMPEADRPLLEKRLRIWEQLSPPEQEILLSYAPDVFGTNQPTALHNDLPLSLQTSNKLRRIEEQLARWQAIPPKHRLAVHENFTNVFGLHDSERLARPPLSPEELQTIDQSLQQFRQLAPAQREQCLRNFERFADLSPEERRQFLVSAQQWQNMPPSDRAAWRNLVSRMPPLPPRLFYPPVPKSTRVASNSTNE